VEYTRSGTPGRHDSALDQLEADAEALKLKKGAMSGPAWEAEFEKLMIELAKVARDIKAKS